MDTTINICPLEPKKVNRFYVEFPKDLFAIEKYVIYEVTNLEAMVDNSGYLSWSPVIFKMYDPINPSTSHFIMDILQKNKGRLPTCDKAVTVKVKVLGPVGDIVSEWKLTGKVMSIDFGSFNWQSTSFQSIEMNFDIHQAELLY
jgi:hypothetical protein